MKDATGNGVVFNASATLVIGLKQDLGSDQTKVNREVTSIILDNVVQIYPNPSASNAILNFSILESSMVSINIYNTTGQLIATPISNDKFEFGNYQFEIPESLLPGFYLIAVKINDQLITEKFLKY